MSRLPDDGTFSPLNAVGIFTVNDFVKADGKLIEHHTNLSFREILRVKKDLINKYAPKPVNGYTYYKYLIRNSAIFPTGIKRVDDLLSGGFATSKIYEISGLPACGKTILCKTLAKHVVTNLNQKVFYLDSKRNFSAKRFRHMLNNANYKALMENVLLKELSTKYDLTNSLFDIKQQIQNGLNVRVIIIDSLAPLFMDTKDNTENNNTLSHCANIMRYIATQHHAVIIVTNLMTLWRESSDFVTYDVLKKSTSCGKFWQTVPNVKITLEKHVDADKVKLEVIKGPKIDFCDVTITDLGIC